MSGRRSYARFNITPSSEGLLRVFRDVTVHAASDDEFIALSRDPGVVGDLMTLEMAESHGAPAVLVRVIDSRPVLIDGALRHRLRLRRAAPPSNADGEGSSNNTPEESR